ncbi:MAG TPA: hypothetical protein DDZ88_06465 [Verrucomicrobiales bacterium]|nr:hypothetical protein [Verrucomicrobiales bacterium]
MTPKPSLHMKRHITQNLRLCVYGIALLAVSTSFSWGQSVDGKCSEIVKDVTTAITKDPSKVLMVVEDALVINEGCAAEIVRAAILASKADAVLASQIVQTATAVAPRMAAAIDNAAQELIPGYVSSQTNPVELTASGKNPGKNMTLDSPEPEEEETTLDSPVPGGSAFPLRGVSVPGAPTGSIVRTNTNPVSPSTASP